MIFPSLFWCNPAQFLGTALRDTSLVVPVAIRAASVWDFLNFLFSNCVQLSHIISPYSSKGLIKVVNIISRELLSNLNLSFRIILILFHAFLVMQSICWCQVQSLDRNKPRCL